MRLYAGSSADFIALCEANQVASLLEAEFTSVFLCAPSVFEVNSWKKSLACLAKELKAAGLTDQGIMLEYKLPLSGNRVDVLICGTDMDYEQNAVLIELKQWSKCDFTDYDSDYVLTQSGGENRSLLHPSVQVGNYMHYLRYNSGVFYQGDKPIKLSACSYLHNYHLADNDVLVDERFREAINKFPLFTADDQAGLAAFLTEKVGTGNGMQVLLEIEHSEVRPSQKILDKISTAIKKKLNGQLELFGRCKSKGDYILLDEQLMVHDLVTSLARKGVTDKQAIIVKGGAGTGKSVVGLQLLADLTAYKFNAQYATGSNAFTETLKEILGKGSSAVLKYFMSYGSAKPNSVDVLLMDEAHRIRERTDGRYDVTGLLQIQDLLNAARISVFFVDDYQVVREGELGSSSFIRAQAEAAGCKVYEFELKANFRNGGSERYSDWIDHMLHIRETMHTEWVNEPAFKFEIMESPEALEQVIREKAQSGSTARIMAGFCWNWTKRLDPQGELYKDIKIGNYQKPWNAYNYLNSYPKDVPKAKFWAYQSGGINQVGCIYTAQGFEFDYAGVIFGKDVRYNPATHKWEGFEQFNYDAEVRGPNFVQFKKNTYRVLLGRGMKACYVYFMDKDTETYFRSRIGIVNDK